MAVKTQRIRAVTFAGVAVIGLFATGAGVADLFSRSAGSASVRTAAVTPSRSLDRSLDAYVLFGFDSLEFQGAETPGRGVISGGDVGANNLLNICANHRATLDDGSQIASDSLRITELCNAWDVFANHLVGGSKVAARHGGPFTFAPPILSAPSFPSFSANPSAPVTVPNGGAATLAPGVYGDVTVKDGAHLTFQSGVYVMRSFTAGKHVTITTRPGAELRITNTFALSNDTTFGPTCDVPVYVRADGTGVHDFAINFSKQTTVTGRFLTVKGHIALGHATNLTGHFWGNQLSSDVNVNVHGCSTPPTTTTTTLASTTTILETPTTTTTTVPTSSTTTTTTTVPHGTTTTQVAPTSVTAASTSTTTPVGPQGSTTTTVATNPEHRTLPRTGADLALIGIGLACVAGGALGLLRRRGPITGR